MVLPLDGSWTSGRVGPVARVCEAGKESSFGVQRFDPDGCVREVLVIESVCYRKRSEDCDSSRYSTEHVQWIELPDFSGTTVLALRGCLPGRSDGSCDRHFLGSDVKVPRTAWPIID